MCAKFLPAKSADKNTQQAPSIDTENDENYCSRNNVEHNECVKVTQPPLYSVPNKLKSKRALRSSNTKLESDHSTSPPVRKSHDVEGLQIEEVEINAPAHIYYVCTLLDYVHTHYHMHTQILTHINTQLHADHPCTLNSPFCLHWSRKQLQDTLILLILGLFSLCKNITIVTGTFLSHT